jgi:CRISPR type I-E-associated protein CasB/Cse2
VSDADRPMAKQDPRRAAALAIAAALRRMQSGTTSARAADRSRAAAQRAALRRGIGGSLGGGFGHDPRADAALLQLLGERAEDALGMRLYGDSPSDLIEAAALVAMLVAYTRAPLSAPDTPWSGRSLGRDLHRVKAKRSSEVYGRLVQELLRADRDRIARPLRRALTLMADDGGSLDAAVLIRDLCDWSRDDGQVQKRWAFHFWAPSPVAAEADDATHHDDGETA